MRTALFSVTLAQMSAVLILLSGWKLRENVSYSDKSQAKPKPNWGGGDAPLSVSHSRVTGLYNRQGEYAYANDFEVRLKALTDVAKE